jgi:hypothetical protein
LSPIHPAIFRHARDSNGVAWSREDRIEPEA